MAPRDGRVVVRDLPAAEPIRPTPQYQGVNVGAPRQINNNWEELGRSLTAFNKELAQTYGLQKQEEYRGQSEAKKAELQQWLAARTPTERLTQLPGSGWLQDPYVRATANAEYGALGIQNIAAGLDQDPAWRERFGRDNTLDIHAELRNRAAPFVERLRGSAHGSKAAVDALDRVAQTLTHKHDELRTKFAQQTAREAAGRNIEQTVYGPAADADDAHDPQFDLGQAYSQWQDAYGPRVGGGTLDMGRRELMEEFLHVSERNADTNPLRVLQELDRQRFHSDTGQQWSFNGIRSGPLAATVERVRRRAEDAAFDLAHKVQKQAALQILRGVVGGEIKPDKPLQQWFADLQDVVTTTPFSHRPDQQPKKYTVEQLWHDYDDAAAAEVERSRQPADPTDRRSDEQRAADAWRIEKKLLLDTGRKSPTATTINSFVDRELARNADTPGNYDEMRRLMPYWEDIMMNRQAWAQGANGLSQKSRRFFAIYQDLLLNGQGIETPQTAFSAARAAVNRVSQQDPHLTSAQEKEIDTAVKGMDFSRLLQIGDYGSLGVGGGVINVGSTRADIKDMALHLYAAGRAGSASEAVARAAQMFEKGTVWINGVAMGGDTQLVRGLHEPGIQQFFRKLYDYKDQDGKAVFAAQVDPHIGWFSGVVNHGSEYLIPMPTGPAGRWEVRINAGNGVFLPLTYPSGNPVSFDFSDVQRWASHITEPERQAIRQANRDRQNNTSQALRDLEEAAKRPLWDRLFSTTPGFGITDILKRMAPGWSPTGPKPFEEPGPGQVP